MSRKYDRTQREYQRGLDILKMSVARRRKPRLIPNLLWAILVRFALFIAFG